MSAWKKIVIPSKHKRQAEVSYRIMSPRKGSPNGRFILSLRYDVAIRANITKHCYVEIYTNEGMGKIMSVLSGNRKINPTSKTNTCRLQYCCPWVLDIKENFPFAEKVTALKLIDASSDGVIFELPKKQTT